MKGQIINILGFEDHTQFCHGNATHNTQRIIMAVSNKILFMIFMCYKILFFFFLPSHLKIYLKKNSYLMDHFRNRWCTRFGLWAVVTNSVLTGFLVSYISSPSSLYTAVWVGILTPKVDHVRSPDYNITLRVIPYSQNGQHSRIWPTTPFLWSLSLSCQTPKVTVEPTFSPNFTSLHILFPLPGVFAPPFSTLRTPIHELRKLSLSPSPPINGKRWVSFLCASVASSFLSLHCFHSTVTAYTDLAPL